jgi:hypothetical protein
VSRPTRSWKDVLGGEPVNEQRAALYARLMRAQERIAHFRYALGVDDQLVQDALDAADGRLSEAEQREDLYLSALAHFVEAWAGTSKFAPCSTMTSSSSVASRTARLRRSPRGCGL